jgi:hypothetical protein
MKASKNMVFQQNEGHISVTAEISSKMHSSVL